MNLELNVVRFENEDVIATSGEANTWSTYSYKAMSKDALAVEPGTHQNGKLYAAWWNNNNGKFDNEDGYNKIDGDVVPGKYGYIFTRDTFYHYDINSLFSNGLNANIFQTCTDPSHQYQYPQE